MDINRKINSQSKRINNKDIMKPLLDIQTLDFYCRYIISENKNIRVSDLNLIKNFFEYIDPIMYNDQERVKRIEFVKRGLDARLVKKLNEKSLIIRYINGGMLDEQLLDTTHMLEISDETLKYLNEQAAEMSKSYFVDDKYDRILNLATNLKNSNYKRRSEVVEEIQKLTSEMNLQFNKMDDAINTESMFTLLPGEFENSISDTYLRETNPSKILRTGMNGLNIMLDGGFQSSRVYMILALAAGGKSFTMIDLALQIKKYNKDYKPHDPTKIPTIVFLTMENSKDENISRIMNMGTGGKGFCDYSMEESFDVLRNNGLGYNKVSDPIDIVMVYRPNLSINTDFMYTLVDKLRESGREPICFFQDHIKRIRPVNKFNNDVRLELGEIINEFKSFANNVGIPVITDSHLNRGAAAALDDSTDKNGNKQDLIRNLGSKNVSESFLMIDNCDVGVIINKEADSENNLYMGFKCIKTRTKCDLDLFYQPYYKNNPIKLKEDIEEPIPLFKRTLKPEVNAGFSVQSRYSRINPKDPRDDDSEDFFGSSNMATPTDNILLPDNANQKSFVLLNNPSTPIYNCYTNTKWENELEIISKNNNMTMGIVYLDDNNMVVGDGLDRYSELEQ